MRRLVSPDPTGSVLWAATGGGVFHSGDAGETWTASSTGLESLDVTDLDVCRSDPSHLIVSTRQAGLYLSSDGGATWQRVPSSAILINFRAQTQFWRAAINPTNPSHLLATAGDSEDLFESVDGGSTWRDLGVYPVTRFAFSGSGMLYFSTQAGQVYRLSSAGSDPVFLGSPSSNVPVVDLALPGGDGLVLAAAVDGKGLFVSENGGGTWLLRHAFSNPEDFLSLDAVAADPTNASRLVYHVNDSQGATQTALYNSLDLGASHSALTLPEAGMEIGSPDVGGIYLNSRSEWLCENKAGLFRRDRAGAFAHSSRGLAAYSVRDFAFLPGGSGTLAVVGGQQADAGNGGMHVWDSTSSLWVRRSSGLPAGSSQLVRYRGSDFWIGIEGSGLFRSQNAGLTWTDQTNGISSTTATDLFYGLAFVPSGGQGVAGTAAGVYRTADTGASWQRVSSLPASDGWRVANDRRNDQGFFLGGYDGVGGRFYGSTNGGATWQEKGAGLLSGLYIASMDASSQVDGHVLIGTRYSGLYDSSNGGTSWQKVSGGFPETGQVNAVALGDLSGDLRVAAHVINQGPFVSTDGGFSWLHITEGLAATGGSLPLVHALRFEPGSARVVVGLQGGGLRYLDLEFVPDTTPPTVSADPPGGSGTQPFLVALTASEAAAIYFTLDGSTPSTSSTRYSSPITIPSTTTLTFFAVDLADNAGATVTEVYTITGVDTTPPVVTASVDSGTYTSAISVALTPNEPADIFYTLNGTDPTTSSAKYVNGNPLAISVTTTLKFFGVDLATNAGAIETRQYTIKAKPSSGGGGGGGGGGGCFVGSLAGAGSATVWISVILALLGVLRALPAGAAGPFGGTVTSLHLAADGKAPLWAATSRGLFHAAGGRWRRVEALGQREIGTLVVTPDGILVAVTAGLLASSDGDGQWDPVTQGLNGRYGHKVTGIFCLAGDIADPSHLYLGSAGQGPFESKDGGKTWRLILEGLENEPPPAFHVRAFLPSAPGRPLLMGTDGRGLFAWQEGRWTSWGKGLPLSLRVRGLKGDPSDSRHLVLAAGGEGLWESRDGGASWTLVRKGTFGVVDAVSVGEGGDVLAHFPEDGLFLVRGGDAGTSTGLANAALSALEARKGGGWIAGLAHDGVLAISADGVPGELRNEGLDATGVLSLVAGEKAGELWAGDTNGVFFSSNGGFSWQPRDKGLIGASVTEFLWHKGRLCLGTGGQGVYRWVPESLSWEPRSAGLGTSNTIFSFVEDADREKLYVGTEGGVLRSDNSGGLWATKNKGLNAGGDWIVAASRKITGGVWAAGMGKVVWSQDAGESWSQSFDARPVALLAQVVKGTEVLWILEPTRLSARDGSQARTISLSLNQGERLTCLAARADTLWVGSTQGVWKIPAGADGGGTRVWTGAAALSLLPLGDGSLIVGTDGKGVVALPK